MSRLTGLLNFKSVRFLIVGAGAAGLLFLLSYLFVSVGMEPFAGSTLAYAIAFICAYFTQRGWTFGAAHSHGHALPRYLATQIACAVLAGVTAHVTVKGFGAPTFAMSALATAIASGTSFLLSRYWVFPDQAGTIS